MPTKQTPLQLILTRLKESFPSLLLIISLLCLFSGLIGIIFLQSQGEKQSFDVRQQASEPAELTMFLESPQANATLNLENTDQGVITLNLSNENIDAASIVFFVTSQTIANPEIILKNPDFVVTSSEIEKTTDGYIVSIDIKKETTAIVTDVRQPLFSLQFTARQNESVTISFDADRSIVYRNNDTQKLVADSFKVTLQTNDTNVETVPLSTTSASNDEANSSPANDSRPSPTPSINPATGARPDVLSCNQTCSSNAQCPANHLCYNTGTDRRCRLVTNPTSTSCSTPTDNGLNRQCNQYCADNRECGSGLSCWFNRCRRPDNIESTTCSQPSATVVQNIAQSCNTSCTSNSQCAINMRCYNSQCRLASNPSSTSCSALTTPTVSTTYNTKGGLNASESATATTSGTVVTPQPSFVPIPSPVISLPDTSTADTPVVDNSFLGTLRQYFTSNTRELALGLLALGMGILLLFLLLALMRKLRRKPPATSASDITSTPPVTSTYQTSTVSNQLPTSNSKPPTATSQGLASKDLGPVKIAEVPLANPPTPSATNQGLSTKDQAPVKDVPPSNPPAPKITHQGLGTNDQNLGTNRDQGPNTPPALSIPPRSIPKIDQVHASTTQQSAVSGQPPQFTNPTPLPTSTNIQVPIREVPTANPPAPKVTHQGLGTNDQGLKTKDQTSFTTSSGTKINFNKPPTTITPNVTSTPLSTSTSQASKDTHDTLSINDSLPIGDVPPANPPAPSAINQGLSTKDQEPTRSSMLQRIQDKKIALKSNDQ